MQRNKPCNIFFRPLINVGNVPLAGHSLFVAIGFNQVSASFSVNYFPSGKHFAAWFYFFSFSAGNAFTISIVAMLTVMMRFRRFRM